MGELKVYRATLHTGCMTAEKLTEKWGGEVSLDEIVLYEKIYKAMDGQEAAVVASFEGGEVHFLALTDRKADKELSYLMEQDPFIGCYIDDRDGFEKEYDSGEYFRDVSFMLDAAMVERLVE